MANRRMFSKDIVRSDAFLDMPLSSQLLYFQLGMEADDDGFIGNNKMVMRMIGGNEDDMKILLTKRFILPFKSGVIVIKHWKINNYIPKDRYVESKYTDEKKLLITKENRAYTECIHNVDGLDTQYSIGKSSIDKNRIDNTSEQSSQEISEIIDSFKEINPSYKKFFSNTTQRSAVSRLLELNGKEKLLKVIALLPKSNSMEYMPVITTPLQLEDKFAQLVAAWQKFKNNQPLMI